MVAPKYTPGPQLNDSMTSGTVVARRPPKMMAEIGTPFGLLTSGESAGLFSAGEVKRLFGCAAFSFDSPLTQGLPCQSVRRAGASPPTPSHQTVLSSGMATFVKMVFFRTVFIALGLDLLLVPGATPK